MGKLRFMAGFIFALFASGLLLAGIASAHDFRAGNNSTVAQDEVIESTLFMAGNNVDIAGEVFGDVFCAGQNVTVSGTVHGDVLCAGQTVRVSGMVDGDVRLAGQTVSVSSEVSGNATVAGQNFTLDSSGSIGGDITIGSENASLNGAVGRDVAVGGTTVTIANVVGRNVKGDLTNLELTGGARVAGNVEYTSRNELTRAADAIVGGSITRTSPDSGTPKRGAVFGFTLGWFIYLFLAMLVASLAIALLFPRVLHNASERAMPRPWKALLVGIIASLAIPVSIVVIGITVIGIPLALLLVMLWMVIVLLSGPFTGYYLGRWLVPNSKNPLFIMLVGASSLLVLYFLPFIGFFALVLGFWIGIGMILLEVTRRTPKPAYSVPAGKAKTSKK